MNCNKRDKSCRVLLCPLFSKDIGFCKVLYVTERYWQLRASLEPDCCGCLLLKWMQNWFHASTHCSSPWADRWWHWLWFVLKEITLISAALSPNGQSCCVRVHVSSQVCLCTYMCKGTCVPAQVSLNLSVWRQICWRLERAEFIVASNLLRQRYPWKLQKVKVRLEVSREFRRDREKDFVLPHEDSFCQLNVTERISEWPQNSVPHEQSVISKHSSRNIRPLRDTPQWQFI